ncbi:MAG: DPP IV N-terminal domain-containing protein [Ignavibacteriaceae bacterium]|nr:DPP IV N-terminal domain-containing protein [Ignavibacteriaceae bacterium]
MTKRTLQFFIILFAVSLLNVSAQDKKLTFKQVYMGAEPRLVGSIPRVQGWLDESHYLESKTEAGTSALYKVNAETGESEIFINYTELKKDLPKGFTVERADDKTADYAKYIFNGNNDIYFYNRLTKEWKQLTNTPDIEEKNPTLSPDGNKAAFTRENDLYVVDINSGKETRLTFDGTEAVKNGYASWVYMEEIIGRASAYKAYGWAPNSDMIVYLRFDDSPVPKFPLYRADGVHGELEWEYYPKPGDPNPIVKLGVADVNTAKTVWIDEDTTDRYVAFPFWSSDGKTLYYERLNRGQDTMVIYSANPQTAKREIVYTEVQPSWVDFFEDIYVFNDGTGFLLRSSVSGYYHLYYYNMKGKLIKQLTTGDWDVDEIIYIDEKNKTVYFDGSMGESTETHLYKVDLEGNTPDQLTSIPATHSCQVSPGGKYFIDRYSSINAPNKLELFDSDGDRIRLIADAKQPAMDEFNLGKTELFRIPSSDGFNLPAKWILPPDFDEAKKYPVVFSIYSGPGNATVANSYPYWFADNYLASKGIIVISLDHRGSGHFGKKGIALMHRNLGKWEMEDLINAVKWLRKKSFVDSTKIGITGGSYGGYTTCMALTYGADYFTHGIAEYSVTDWGLYDNVYTERFMDQPSENPEGYKFGSAMEHAENYKGKLLITHGTMDDNVHMQNTLQLIDKLENLNKDFDLMLYPNARHGVGFPKFFHAAREQYEFWISNFFDKKFDMNKD